MPFGSGWGKGGTGAAYNYALVNQFVAESCSIQRRIVDSLRY